MEIKKGLENIHRQNIQTFIDECRRRILVGKMVLEPRDKNFDCLAKLGLNIKIVESLISDLTVADYCEGPTDGHKYREEEIWIFSLECEETEIYVKLKLKDYPIETVVCISFHESKYKMIRPFF